MDPRENIYSPTMYVSSLSATMLGDGKEQYGMNMLTDEVTVGLQRAPSTPRPYCVAAGDAAVPTVIVSWRIPAVGRA